MPWFCPQPRRDLAELEPTICRMTSSAIGKYGHDVMRPSSAGLKCLSSAGPDRLTSAVESGRVSGSAQSFMIDVGAEVRRHQDDRVLEVDHPALAVLEHALVEHLVEEVQHVGVGLLHLVESTTE